MEIRSWPQTAGEFDDLIALTQDELVSFAYYRLGNRHDAEDVVQDVYVHAFRDRARRRGITEVRPYLFRMVRNRCTDLLRVRARRTAIAPEVSGGDGCLELEERERVRLIVGLLERIPEREAEVIRLRAWSGLSYAAIAAAVGSSVPTVKSRFRYGVGKLRRLMFPGGGAER